MSLKQKELQSRATHAPWQELVERNIPLVKYVLGKLSRNLPPVVDRNDLFAAGSMGLLEAAQRYDPARKVPFHSYAIPRIWGSMVDELRGNDHLSTDMRSNVSKMEKCRGQLRMEAGAEPSMADVAKRMGCSQERVTKLMSAARAGQPYASTEAAVMDIEDARAYARRGAERPRNPFEEAEFQDNKEVLAECISNLPEREKKVILLRYHEGLYLHEIGELLNVSESRICQIHGQALKSLRKALERVGLSATA